MISSIENWTIRVLKDQKIPISATDRKKRNQDMFLAHSQMSKLMDKTLVSM